ncbi:glycosyltransferase family 4 protein [Sulfitobacter sp. TSTF-M16]|uniref:Glycosyltransferase family 4 protein n=1 Tax=Sulfitobacter aestuariivivens TaxID=2766981 RepID=A0A927D507_9RHOB|nr:glycosyltransferase family 4 protein [Sulfitobacter aestuariivivens]MBD3665150.1 glycosyltransferase family 4 protein [Sulfitobacter aestuariivivens]
MAVSEPLPHVVLVGGDGGPSGVPRHMLHLADAYKDTARVTVISDANFGGFDQVADTGAEHITIKGLQSKMSFAHLWAGWRGLLRYVRKTDADLVWLHARMPVLMGRAALALRLWRPDHPVAVTFHGLPFGKGHKPRASHVSLVLEKALLSACPPLDLVFLTRPMAETMQKAMGNKRWSRHRIHVLPNASNLGELPDRTPAPGTNLVMTGRAGWQKNYAAAARLLAALPSEFTLTLCGAGTQDAAFQQEISADLPDDVSQRLRFTGPLNDVRAELMCADGYLLCSRYEGLPIGALEAFEAGLPIALAPFDGADDLVSRHPYATLLSLTDMAADAARIETLLRRYRADGDAARVAIRQVWAQNWSPQAFTSRSRSILDKLLGG